jgi:hypothetical protein
VRNAATLQFRGGGDSFCKVIISPKADDCFEVLSFGAWHTVVLLCYSEPQFKTGVNAFSEIFLKLTPYAVCGTTWLQIGNMKTNLKRLAKDAILRARCDSRLKENVEKIAYLQQLDESDIVRIACAAYVQKFQANAIGS